MTYDILIRNGRVVDGTGSPAFNADVGIRNGKIAGIGRLRGNAKRTIDAKGQVVAPGFIDSHTHFDAQVTWDPLCTWSCYHGVTTVIMGNCSLGIAPLRPGTLGRVAEFLSFVEAIPMETLQTVKPTWETFGQFLDSLENRMGMNVGALAGHTPIRYYVMGEDSQGRDPTSQEMGQMKDLVRDAMESGALGLSFGMNPGHYDSRGEHIPSFWAKEEEIFALAGVLGELGTGVLQTTGGKQAEMKSRLMSRLSEKTGRPMLYQKLERTLKKPDEWKQHMELIDDAMAHGIRAFPSSSPQIPATAASFTMHNCQMFRGVRLWHEVQMSKDDAVKLKAFADPEFRKTVHHELVDWPHDVKGNQSLSRNWPDLLCIQKAKLEKNRKYEDMSIRELAGATGKGIIDAFLDLAIEEDLDTEFVKEDGRGGDPAIMGKILNYPHAIIGLSDAGAHVQFRAGYGFTSVMLGHWVRRHKIMSLEAAVKKLTFDVAQFFGIYDRGLVQPGMAADLVIFDPETIRSLDEGKVSDLPGGAWRMKETAEGVMCTIVNGQVLIEEGRHTGALPGHIVRNSLYRERKEIGDMQGKAVAMA